MKRSARSAFAARRQAVSETSSPVPVSVTARVENREEEDVGEEEQVSADGVSDDEIGFTNSFEALNNAPMVRTQSRKKIKVDNGARVDERLSTVDRKRIVEWDIDTLKVTLLPDEILTVCGTFLLSVVQGSVSILGAKLPASSPATSYPVYAPHSHSLPVITGLKSKKTRTTESIIHLKTHRSGIHRLPAVCPFTERLFDPPANSVAVSSKDASFHILFESSIAVPRTIYPISWHEAYHTISKSASPSILVCGQKGVGKSTFCQYLTNSLIRRKTVTYLETDPGQPAFSPPGLITLHKFTQPILSPPFIRSGMNNLIRCQHIGNISPRDNPRHYIDCISDLLSHDERSGPTIINTPGWTKGTGFELLTSLIEIEKPEFVVVVAPEGNDTLAQSLHPFASPCGGNILVIGTAITVPAVVPLTAAELRTLGIMSYFHLTGLEKWDFGTHLTEWKPLMARYSGAETERGIYAVAIQGEEIYQEDILLSINATMVAIIVVKNNDNDEVVVTSEGVPTLLGRESKFMDPTIARCVGYSIIRGIDVKEGQMMLLTPWDPATLGNDERVVLERGRVNLPVWAMWDHKSPQKIGPYLKWQ